MQKRSVFLSIWKQVTTTKTTMMATGGLGSPKPVDDNIIKITKEMEKDVVKKLGKTAEFSEFKPISYRSQLVAGTNYFIKVKVGENEYVHIRVYQTLPHAGCKLSLTSAVEGKTHADTIEYM